MTASETWGLDNVEVQVELLLPDVFDIGATAMISDGVPGPGAGNIELPRAADEYRFEVTSSDNGLYVDPTACDRFLGFRVLRSDGSIADEWSCGAARPDHQVDLAPGSYVLEVSRVVATTYAISTYVVPADIAATATIGGGAVAFDLTTPGQAAVVSFQGAVGDRVSVEVAHSFDNLCQVTVTAPSGDTWDKTRGCQPIFDVHELTEAGTYTVSIDPSFAGTGPGAVTVFAVPADVAATAAVGGGPVAVDITVPGQAAVVTFAGTGGDRVSMEIAHPFGFCGVDVAITAPSGALVWPT